MTTVITPRGFYLGKKEPVASPFGEFKTYFTETLAAPPPGAHWGGRVKAPWQMDGNGPDPQVTIAPPGWSGAGNCVEAFKAHALLTANYDEGGHTVPAPSANAVVEQYCVYQGCTPQQLFANPNQYDNGEDMTTSLLGWCKVAQYGAKAAFTATVNTSKTNDILNGVYLGGGLGIGIQVRENNEVQFPGTWTWDPTAQVLGGHAIWVTGYDIAKKLFWLVSWGQLIAATFEMIFNSIDEGHVVVLPQAIAAGKSPTNLLIPQWEAELNSLAA